ncbi:hypothetical protein Tsubulata_030065, partial [Turnera subulata]
MAQVKYSRVDNNRRQSSYCSTVTVVVFVALCLVGVWMLTSSSVVPGQSVDVPADGKKNEVKEQVTDTTATTTGTNNNGNEENTKQFEDNQGDLPEDATKGDANLPEEKPAEEKVDEKPEEKPGEEKPEEQKNEEETKSDDGSNGEAQNEDGNGENGDGKKSVGETSSDGDGNASGDGESNADGQGDSNITEKKSDSGDNEEKSNTEETSSGETKDGETENNQGEEKVDQKDNKESEKSGDGQGGDQNSGEVFPSGAQSELLNENATQKSSFSTQAAESKNEKEAQRSSQGYEWKLCNVSAGPDYIPCLDNWQAIKSLRSTKHYEHRERHCPEEPPTCVVPLPEGYKKPIEWPKSREKVWYSNVPHTKLAQVKGHQNWVKVTGEYLTFPGGGTQFKHGALHYIDFINESLPEIAWGKRSRVVLDVGCGVASFGGYLFDRDVLTMSLAPKDEHEAQVQFALERGIPAISAVMGTLRLPYPGRVFDIVHCARCRVPWHIEGGKLLLELNRVLRPGGFFVWSATPVYQKLAEDVEIWNAMSELTKAMCWELVSITKDTVNGVGIATYKKPTTNECYEKRSKQEPPLCEANDDP